MTYEYHSFPEGMTYHEFLFDKRGRVSEHARQVPVLREHIESMPVTCSTFTLTTVEDVLTNIPDPIVEFAGAWQAPPRYRQRKRSKRLFVSPRGVDAYVYTDCAVECACGALLSHVVDHGNEPVSEGTEHAAGCERRHREAARRMLEVKRIRLLRHCMALGWDSDGVAVRMGSTSQSNGGRVGSYVARRNGMAITDLRNAYRATAGRTYSRMVHDAGVRAREVADIYGVTTMTLQRWARDHAGIRPGRGATPARYADGDD